MDLHAAHLGHLAGTRCYLRFRDTDAALHGSLVRFFPHEEFAEIDLDEFFFSPPCAVRSVSSELKRLYLNNITSRHAHVARRRLFLVCIG